MNNKTFTHFPKYVYDRFGLGCNRLVLANTVALDKFTELMDTKHYNQTLKIV